MAQSGSKGKLNDPEWLREEYIGKGRTQEDIANELGYTDGYISMKMSEFGIRTRPAGGRPEPLLPRFWDYVDKGSDGECWEWAGNVTGRGYGSIGVAGKDKKAHRISYHLANKGIPEGKQINHHCDNKTCVNPDHLYAGDQADNVQDAWDRDRMPDEKPNLRGRNNPKSKIDKKTAEKIKEMLESDMTNNEISENLGVSLHIVNDISRGRTWTYV